MALTERGEEPVEAFRAAAEAAASAAEGGSAHLTAAASEADPHPAEALPQPDVLAADGGGFPKLQTVPSKRSSGALSDTTSGSLGSEDGAGVGSGSSVDPEISPHYDATKV